MTTAYQHLRAYAATRVGLDNVEAYNTLANAVQDQIDDIVAAALDCIADATDPARPHDPHAASEPVTTGSLGRLQRAISALTGDYSEDKPYHDPNDQPWQPRQHPDGWPY